MIRKGTRIFESIKTNQPESEQELRNSNLLLQAKGIHRWFGKIHALKGVDLSVRKGEAVGLIGDNGAGKSTLIKIISGVIPPTKGRIYFEGKEVNVDSVYTARQLGIETVHQDRAVIGDLDITKNIFMTREVTRSFGPLKILDHRKMEQEARKLTEKLGLRIASPDQEVRFCSGGERQGVAIARAMYFQSKLLILDEPTTALSASGVRKVLSFVEHLKEEEVGIIYITHNLHDVYPIADRFVVMIQGEVVADVLKEDITVEDLEKVCITGLGESLPGLGAKKGGEVRQKCYKEDPQE